MPPPSSSPTPPPPSHQGTNYTVGHIDCWHVGANAHTSLYVTAADTQGKETRPAATREILCCIVALYQAYSETNARARHALDVLASSPPVSPHIRRVGAEVFAERASMQWRCCAADRGSAVCRPAASALHIKGRSGEAASAQRRPSSMMKYLRTDATAEGSQAHSAAMPLRWDACICE